jgi:hexulose-6-phosphate isomerase
VDEFNSPMVGWHFDIGNVINFGWPEQWTASWQADRGCTSRNAAARSATPMGRGRFGVLLLEGDNDWPAIMKALDDVRYAGGWATAEVGGGDLEKMKDVSARLDRILAS